MVRHSGFLPSLLAVMLAALAVSVLERRTDGGSEARRRSRDENGPVSPIARQLQSDCDRDQEAIFRLPMNPDSAIRFHVPPNSLIIVGSLDTSGAAHSLRISSQPGGHWSTSASYGSQSRGALQYIQSASLSESHQSELKPTGDAVTVTGSMPLSSRQLSTVQPPDTVQSLKGSRLRRFLVPHFEHDQVVQEPREALAIAEGSRVKVYIDLSLVDTPSELPQNHPLRDTAYRACETIENELLPLVEEWIGRITDLDGDHQLSVVLTDLDRRKSSNETPVLGCVRRHDFTESDQNSLTGDILYLDQHLPPQEQLRALLAHELTHAAVFCICHEAADDSPLKDHVVPSWLNEAAAHWVERQFCSAPAGFAARESAFRQNPAQCPIILKDDDHSLTSRRAGSRVAGVTFLQQHLSDANALRELLHHSTPFDKAISTMAQAPFSELFREWSIRQACVDQDTVSPLRSRVDCLSLKPTGNATARRTLYGTAFLVLHSDAPQEICIDANQDAQLQITVLHGSNSTSTQRSPDFSAMDAIRSANLETGPSQAIR